MSEEAVRYYDPMKNWSRIKPHLKAAEPVLVRDFNRYTWGRWRKEFVAGMVPHDFESCGWWLDHRGRKPAFWQYAKHGACHWLVNHNLELARSTLPQYEWRIITSDEHSTVYNGNGLLFDLNSCALEIPATECYLMASENGDILPIGAHLEVDYADHYSQKR
jgi:hypothetical protein